MSDTRPGVLSVVGTPIGNLQDASPRVVDTLRHADLLLCEDTRVTAKLLARFDIRVPLRRCDENVIGSRVEEALDRVEGGERLAFVSDAGMPGVSDPGRQLVDAALDRALPVEVIPGPSAVVCALVASGLSMEHFFFEGFLPRKAGPRQRRLAELAAVPGTLVFYESPHRVAATLASVAEVMPARRVALVRELTKLHEEVTRGSAIHMAERYGREPEVRGECVIVVERSSADEQGKTPGGLEPAGKVRPSLAEAIRTGLDAGEHKSQLAKRLAKEYGVPRSEVYAQLV